MRMVLWSLVVWEGAKSMLRTVTILAAVLTMLLVATAALAQTRSEPGDENELRCFLPEGCDINDDNIPELRAGEPMVGNGDDIPELRAADPVVGNGAGTVQYDNTTH